MNEIKMTVELCTEDRARLDKIIEGLATIGKRPDCSKCVNDVADLMERACDCIDKASKAPKELDDVQKKLAEVVNENKKTDTVEAPKNAQDEPKASDHPTLDPFPEAPTAIEEPSEVAEEKEEPTVTLEMLKSKVIMISAAGKKDQVRELVLSYAPKVTELPANVWAEVYKKLCALEG